MNILRKLNETMDIIRHMTMIEGWREDNNARKVVWNFQTLHTKIDVWRIAGAKTFMLSKDLAEAFYYTDIPLDLTPDEFRYPFNAFMIECESPLFKVEEKAVNHILYINKSIVDMVNTSLVQRDGSIATEIGWDVALTALTAGVGCIGIDQMWVNLKNGFTIEDTYKKGSIYKDQVLSRLPVNKTETQNLMNIFYNTVMYINDPDRRPQDTEVHKTRKMRDGNKKKSKLVKSEYIILQPPKSYISLSKGKGRTIDKRFIVRGHYRNQAYGKKMLQRKKIWIMPFWKGPDMAEIASKKYKVK